MKRSLIAAFAVTLLIVFASIAQDKPKQVDSQKQKHMMEMMKDPAMMDMMMDHVASNKDMRTKMMDRMMSHMKGDMDSKMDMCKSMMKDKEMHSCMMKSMEGMMNHDGMMKSKPDSKSPSHEHKH